MHYSDAHQVFSEPGLDTAIFPQYRYVVGVAYNDGATGGSSHHRPIGKHHILSLALNTPRDTCAHHDLAGAGVATSCPMWFGPALFGPLLRRPGIVARCGIGMVECDPRS